MEEESVASPYAGDLDALMMGLQMALDPYDVMITNERPPEYISYTMLLASDEVNEESMGFTCSGGGINCSALKRNDLIFTNGGTMNCMDPEPVHAALHAFGRVSGLEGVDNVMDVMNYVPDYTMPLATFLDECSPLVQQMGFNDKGDPVMLPLECTSLDHTECPEDENQNSHADLLEFYGARTEDADPPEFSDIVPEDGAVFDSGDVMMNVTVTDADPAVGLRWRISSPAIEDQAPDGLTKCTNDVCDSNWEETPVKPTDSDWSFALELPPGEYTITLEAADYHGNVAEMVTRTVTVGGAVSDSSGGPSDTTDGNDSSQFTTGQDSEDDDGTGSSTSQDDDGSGGCVCTTGSSNPGGAVLMLLGLMGLGTMRRRW